MSLAIEGKVEHLTSCYIDQLYRFDTAILQDDHPFLKIVHESKVARLQEIPFLNDVAVDRRDDYFEEEHGEERNDHEGNV